MKINSNSIRIVFFVASIVFTHLVFANPINITSFNCNRVNSDIERIICNEPKLMQLDYDLADTFQKTKSILSLRQQKQLLFSQKLWLKTRVQNCIFKGILSIFCLEREYKKRKYQLLHEYKVVNDQTKFNIIGAIEFTDFTVHGMVNITQNFLEKLSYAKIDGRGQFTNGLMSVDGRVMVKNCHDYSKYGVAAESGTTYDMAMASFFNINCGILDALKVIKKPKKSLIENISLTDTKALPVNILGTMSDDDASKLDQYAANGKTINDFILLNKVKFRKFSDYKFEMEYNNMHTIVEELVRGDFKGDGLEEILVLVHNDAIGGTYSTNSLYILSKGMNDKSLIAKEVPSIRLKNTI